jgi:HTH-type transcriptional regulator, competence development regulator
MSFGGRLRELRQQRGLKLRALASPVGVDFTYLSKIENGPVPYAPAPDIIRALAKELGADALDLLDLANKVPGSLRV